MNPVALITGASRGIGRGIAVELAALGHDVVINYASNQAAAEETAALCRERAAAGSCATQTHLCRADVSRAADRHELIEFCRARCGRLDVLVNNAGVAPAVRADLLEATEESFDRVLEINLKGPYFLTQLAARWMVEQARARAAGGAAGPAMKIITISSVSAYAASVNRGEYCISKAALAMLTPLFATRLAAHGIQVFEVRPGIIDTDMAAGARDKYDSLIAGGLTPIQRWGTPADVGKAVAAIVADHFPFSTGEVLNVDGGFHLREL